jgi:hypothetical protein
VISLGRFAVEPSDWKARIFDLARIKQELAESDAEGCGSGTCQRGTARSGRGAAGEPLDPAYRAFLRHAGGWRAFFQTVDLLGPDELGGGRRHDLAREMLETIDDAAGTNHRLELLPIGFSEVGRHVFGIGRAGSSIPGTVAWLSGEEVDRWPSFDEFLLAMMDYNRADAEDLRRDAKRP